MGADFEASRIPGIFHPGGSGYDAALADNDGSVTGAVYVYRRSSADRWIVEAYVNAANAAAEDGFSISVALSADGDMLAAGADFDASRAGGGYHPDDRYYAAALLDNSAAGSGAVYVYRRSGARWSVGAYVKAPNTQRFDGFGFAIALSADGDTLAVGALHEDSVGLPAPEAWDFADESVEDAGAVYRY